MKSLNPETHPRHWPSKPERGARAKTQRGAILVMGALMLIVMLGFLGLAVDSGSLFNKRRELQTAADAGAKAAAAELLLNPTATSNDLTTLATAAASANLTATAGLSITLERPIGTQRIVVTAAQTASPYFMQVLGGTAKQVTARAVAEVTAGSSGKPPCVTVFQNTATSGALSLESSSSIYSACDIHVNSTHTSSAIANSGLIKIDGITCDSTRRPNIKVVGTPNNNSNTSRYCPLPTFGTTAAQDPFSGVVAPSIGACDFTNLAIEDGALKYGGHNTTDSSKLPSYNPGDKSATIRPAVYCGGLALKATNTTMEPGVYIFRGGNQYYGSSTRPYSLSVEDGGLVGPGVMIYLTTGASGTDYQAFKPVYFKGNVKMNIAAATSGPYAGILFFQDRSAGDITHVHYFESLKAEYFAQMNGALYLRNSRLRMKDTLLFDSKTNTNNLYTPILAGRLELQGTTVLNINAKYPTSLPSSYPFIGSPGTARLVE
jgi:Flp pilus assembly protein TadG